MKTIIVDEYSSLDAFQPVAIWKRLSSAIQWMLWMVELL